MPRRKQDDQSRVWKKTFRGLKKEQPNNLDHNAKNKSVVKPCMGSTSLCYTFRI